MLRARLVSAALVFSWAILPGVGAFADGVSITGPGDEPVKATTKEATTPATQAAAATSAPAAEGVATSGPSASQPSAESVLSGLLQHGTSNPAIEPTQMGPNVTPAVAGSAPNQPATERLREGAFVWNRAGRLVHDAKVTEPLFAFDSDGKQMKDPPMILLPCRNLMAMEKSSNGGKTKFRVSGQVTEYNGKNYLLITFMQPIRDLNQF